MVYSHTEPQKTKSAYNTLRGLVLGGLASLAGCSYTQDRGLNTEEFAKNLAPNAKVLIGYNRWDYTPGPDYGNLLTTPTIEVLKKELTEAEKQKNEDRFSSIKDTLNLSILLKKNKIEPYITSLQTSSPENGFYTKDFSPNYIVSSGIKFSTEEANKITKAHKYATQHSQNAPGPTQKIQPSDIRFFYLKDGKLEEIITGENK